MCWDLFTVLCWLRPLDSLLQDKTDKKEQCFILRFSSLISSQEQFEQSGSIKFARVETFYGQDSIRVQLATPQAKDYKQNNTKSEKGEKHIDQVLTCSSFCRTILSNPFFAVAEWPHGQMIFGWSITWTDQERSFGFLFCLSAVCWWIAGFNSCLLKSCWKYFTCCRRCAHWSLCSFGHFPCCSCYLPSGKS